MLDVLTGFVYLLRRAGLRISTAELIDAARALGEIGLDDRAAVRAALAATLVKRGGDLPVFDDLFALYLERGVAVVDAATSAPLVAILRGAGMSEERARELLAALATGTAHLPPIAQLAAGVRPPELPPLVRAAAERVGLSGIQSPLQAGMYSFRILDELGVQDAVAAVDGVVEGLAGGLGPGEAAALRELVAGNVGRLRQAVRAYVDDELRRRDPMLGQRLAEATLADRPIAQLTPSELAALEGEVQRLARRLAARLPVPRPDRRRGRLDARATLRRSWKTGGVPFDVRRRHRPVRRPRLLLLCDVSDSVRLVSRFFLALVHALTRRYDRIHTFVFVADLGDATRLFRTRDVDRAIAEVHAGAVPGWEGAWQSSDYGRTLGALASRHLGKIGSRTTVIVLGDGRSNYRPPRADLLAGVRRRAHRLLWLNPEPPAAWGWGDSAMRAYAPHCDRVMTVWNLTSLRAAVDELVKA